MYDQSEPLIQTYFTAEVPKDAVNLAEHKQQIKFKFWDPKLNKAGAEQTNKINPRAGKLRVFIEKRTFSDSGERLESEKIDLELETCTADMYDGYNTVDIGDIVEGWLCIKDHENLEL